MMPCRVVYGLDFVDGGVAYFKDGQLRASYAGAEGLGQGMVREFLHRWERDALGRN